MGGPAWSSWLVGRCPAWIPTASCSKRSAIVRSSSFALPLFCSPYSQVLLTGHPIRVRKRKAVVKHMFRCSGDVMWFKPAELTTKTGLVGHIREAVGTHGLMKVVFNQHVKQNDTVCLSLYKRVYPKLLNDACHVL
jgi:hypothetical protein